MTYTRLLPALFIPVLAFAASPANTATTSTATSVSISAEQRGKTHFKCLADIFYEAINDNKPLAMLKQAWKNLSPSPEKDPTPNKAIYALYSGLFQKMYTIITQTLTKKNTATYPTEFSDAFIDDKLEVPAIVKTESGEQAIGCHKSIIDKVLARHALKPAILVSYGDSGYAFFDRGIALKSLVTNASDEEIEHELEFLIHRLQRKHNEIRFCKTFEWLMSDMTTEKIDTKTKALWEEQDKQAHAEAIACIEKHKKADDQTILSTDNLKILYGTLRNIFKGTLESSTPLAHLKGVWKLVEPALLRDSTKHKTLYHAHASTFQSMYRTLVHTIAITEDTSKYPDKFTEALDNDKLEEPLIVSTEKDSVIAKILDRHNLQLATYPSYSESAGTLFNFGVAVKSIHNNVSDAELERELEYLIHKIQLKHGEKYFTKACQWHASDMSNEEFDKKSAELLAQQDKQARKAASQCLLQQKPNKKK